MLEYKTPSTASGPPPSGREAYLLRLRRVKKYRKYPENITYFVFIISESMVSKASISEGGGPRSGGRSPVPNLGRFDKPEFELNNTLV